MDDSRWPTEWLRGVLELCVLGVLAQQTAYGYVIVQRLEEAGLGGVKGGTLYPLLARLERDGLVRASWVAGDAGPGRKYLEITPAGRALLAERSLLWQDFTYTTGQLLPGAPAARAGRGTG